MRSRHCCRQINGPSSRWSSHLNHAHSCHSLLKGCWLVKRLCVCVKSMTMWSPAASQRNRCSTPAVCWRCAGVVQVQQSSWKSWLVLYSHDEVMQRSVGSSWPPPRVLQLMFVRLLPPDGGAATESSFIPHAQFMQEQNLLDVWRTAALFSFLLYIYILLFSCMQ